VCGIATDVSDRKRLEDALRSSALAVSSAQGPTVFQNWCVFLPRPWMSIAPSLRRPTRTTVRMRVLAFFLDDRVRENFEYVITGTPCETVVGKNFRIYRRVCASIFGGRGLRETRVRELRRLSAVRRRRQALG